MSPPPPPLERLRTTEACGAAPGDPAFAHAYGAGGAKCRGFGRRRGFEFPIRVDLDADWNKVTIPHYGPHPEAYHEWATELVERVAGEVMGGPVVLSNRGRLEAFQERFKVLAAEKLESEPWLVMKVFYDLFPGGQLEP